MIKMEFRMAKSRQGSLRAGKKVVYEKLRDDAGVLRCCERWHSGLMWSLKNEDKRVWELMAGEFERQSRCLHLVAAENRCSKAVQAALGSVFQNKTAEGPVSGRLHGGCDVIDQVEQLAALRAKEVFGADYANVQPHSGTQANQIVIAAVVGKGETILSLPAEQGGHFSHGSTDSVTGKFYRIENYQLNGEDFTFDYESIRRKAMEVRPRLIICGMSAYPRSIDFGKFREIADEVGAYLLADISHISGLVAAGVHQSPVGKAHFVTTSTYKPGGPRGGLILMGKEWDNEIEVDGERISFCELLEKVTFPGVQGTPYFNNIAGKAVFFKEMMSKAYKDRQRKIIENTQVLAEALIENGFSLVTGGTDNHMVLVDVSMFKQGLSGPAAQWALENCGIITDWIELAYERDGCASGIRLGTPIVTKQGIDAEQIRASARMIKRVLSSVEVKDGERFEANVDLCEQVLNEVERLCKSFAIV